MVVAGVIGKLSEGAIFLLFLPLPWTDPRLQLSTHTRDHFTFYPSGGTKMQEVEVVMPGAGGCFGSLQDVALVGEGRSRLRAIRAGAVPLTSQCSGTAVQGWPGGKQPTT